MGTDFRGSDVVRAVQCHGSCVSIPCGDIGLAGWSEASHYSRVFSDSIHDRFTLSFQLSWASFLWMSTSSMVRTSSSATSTPSHPHAIARAARSEPSAASCDRCGMMTVNTTYIGVATDHIIESFRNQLWSGYKTG